MGHFKDLKAWQHARSLAVLSSAAIARLPDSERDGLADQWKRASYSVVLNIADMRTVHSREAYAQLKQHFGDRVFDTTIRASIAYAESAERAVSILDHRPDLGADYLRLAVEVLERLDLGDARGRVERMQEEAGAPAR